MGRKHLTGAWAIVILCFFTIIIPSEEVFGQSKSIKIGLLYPLSGVYAGPAKQDVNGAQLAFDEINNEIAGRQIELIIEDTEAKPEVALTKAKKLVERDKVDVLMGIIWSPNAMAVRGYVNDQKTPLVLSEAAVRPITQEMKSPYIFRSSFASGQLTRPFGVYACDTLGYKKIVVIAFDSVFGREQADFFESGCNESGGEVVEKIFAPVQTADFAPYFGQIRQQDPDAVWALWSGSGALRFVKQYKEFGLDQQYQLLGFGPLSDEFIIAAVGDAARGIITNYYYSPALDTRENERFLEAYQGKYGSEPGIFANGGYTAAKVIIEAAKAIDGEVENTEALLQALRKVEFLSPAGQFRFDEYQNAIDNVYIRKVDAVDGKLVNRVIDTVKDVEQYWPKGKPNN